MNVKLLKKDGQRIKFLVEGIPPSFAGSLRRTMVSEIPTMAIEWVEFIKNGSAMSDEVLANRLGQIPLTYDMKAYKLPKECKCDGEGCSRCQVKLALKKRGPGVVYSDDLKSSDKSVGPAIEKVAVVELFEGEELQFNAIAQLGLGREHAKWKGAVVGYKNLPSIKINSINKKDLKAFVEECPRDVFKIKDGKLIVTDPIKCNLCNKCVEMSENNEIEVSPIEDSLIFDVESVCGLDVEEVVLLATKTLEEKMKNLKKAIKKIK